MVETGGGITDLQGGGALSSGYLCLDGGRTLQNDGTFNWTGGYIYLGLNPLGTTVGNATIVNSTGATFNDDVASSVVNEPAAMCATTPEPSPPVSSAAPRRSGSRSTTAVS